MAKRNRFLINILQMKYLLILFKISLIRINDSLLLIVDIILVLWKSVEVLPLICMEEGTSVTNADSCALLCRHANQWQNSPFLIVLGILLIVYYWGFLTVDMQSLLITLNYKRWVIKDSELSTTKSSDEYLLDSHIHFV